MLLDQRGSPCPGWAIATLQESNIPDTWKRIRLIFIRPPIAFTNLVEFTPFRGTPKKENTMFVVNVFCLKASLALPAAAGDSFAQSGTHEIFTIVE